MDGENPIECPFCGFISSSDYQIMLHLETQHPELGESPFVAKDDASIAGFVDVEASNVVGGDEEDYFYCSVSGCGEALLPVELESHLEMHEQEQGQGGASEYDSDDDAMRGKKSGERSQRKPGAKGDFGIRLSHALRNLDDDDDLKDGENESKITQDMYESKKNRNETRQEKTKAAWKKVLKMPQSSLKGSSPATKPGARRRLGRSELGPYAHEKQMPSWLVKLLEDGDGAVKTSNFLDREGIVHKHRICPNMTAGISPVLEQFLEQDEQVDYAYFCDPAVKHVSKLTREGGFCGYRNIQMMCSYIIGAKSQGYEAFHEKVPSIFQIQEYIETAWDIGINSTCRIETGGIRGTRKYIGTPEAQAMFCSIGIACNAQALRSSRGSGPTYELLFRSVEAYFSDGCHNYNDKVRCTSLPPIYFQHPGHSMTIIGFERKLDGSKNLLVFDPMFHDSASVTKLIGLSFKVKKPAEHMGAYRRGVKYLKKYDEFELLKLTPPPKMRENNNNITDEFETPTHSNGDGNQNQSG
ncbi:uncharacterized protein RSE6_06600 [Rhynchosporium secalis]|uniref:C2H2-type domain-containing protein n=1 Tax=Rhynchosporium secalis TaxID=38038 RepID=A0A1E1MAS1_RHYSE|nr:uncharacterized protein RSE6_06600 [Rhynchosporium secalis]